MSRFGHIFVFASLQVMETDCADEHARIASHVTPGHALSVGHSPFYFNNDAINFATLDYLIHFTEKVSGWVCLA